MELSDGRSESAAGTGRAPRSLVDLEVGDSAVVKRVGCARATAVRLMEMGLLPGTRVTLVRTAPLGDPLELSVAGYALSIRKEEARLVLVGDGQTATRPEGARDAKASATDAVPSPEGT
jgi:Fe2+ transport system protein FeoA